MTLENHIVIMSKFPRLGEVKTRLIPALGAEKAMELHTQMSRHIVARTQDFAGTRNDISFSIHIANGTQEEARSWLGDHQYFLQQGKDLGSRMEHAVKQNFSAGAKRVIVVGTDCPLLTEDEFLETLSALDTHDLVYVPALDGGYVLVGFSGEHYEVFQNINWGSETVLQESLERASAAQLSHHLLSPLADVDREEDVEAALIAMSENQQQD